MSETKCPRNDFQPDEEFNDLGGTLAMGGLRFVDQCNEKQSGGGSISSRADKNSRDRLDIPAMSSNL
jgi:hypothetical protein